MRNKQGLDVNFFFVHTSSCNFTDDVWTKKKFSTFSYKLVQMSPIMILVNSGAFLSISSWFCELTELIFVMIPYISSTGYPPKTQGIMGHVQVANSTNCNTIQIWSCCSRYLLPVGNRYPAVYVASHVGRKSEVRKCRLNKSNVV